MEVFCLWPFNSTLRVPPSLHLSFSPSLYCISTSMAFKLEATNCLPLILWMERGQVRVWGLLANTSMSPRREAVLTALKLCSVHGSLYWLWSIKSFSRYPNTLEGRALYYRRVNRRLCLCMWVCMWVYVYIHTYICVCMLPNKVVVQSSKMNHRYVHESPILGVHRWVSFIKFSLYGKFNKEKQSEYKN